MTTRPTLADVTDPRFTADQLATVAAFETAPTPPEVREAAVVEEVARAIAEAQGVGRTATPLTRRLAAAAVTAYRAQDGGAEEAPLAAWERQLVWAADAVREVHQRDSTEPYACDWCGQAWPCEAIREWSA